MATLRAAGIGSSPTERATLRTFAATWPGALRELDTLPTIEIDRRIDACVRGDTEPWMAPLHRYHALMREALARRRASGPRARLPWGRLNVAVFAQLAREFGRPERELWDALFPPRGAVPRPYRGR